MAGLVLDPWQAFVLRESLGERPDGKWAAFEVGVVVARQNGKGGLLEARELAGLFLLGERLIIHSAHQFDTSLEAFTRLLALIEATPELERRVQRVSRSHGEEGITLVGGQRIRFRTRTKGGGRGFTCDCLILDEAMILPESAHSALLPTLSARPNPQVWYTGSAVDQEVHEHGVVLARVRERGTKGADPGLAYFEWSVDEAALAANPGLATDVRSWGQANPGLGIRISVEHVAREQRSMEPGNFAVERLSVGDWPRTDGADVRVISPEAWAACADPRSQISGAVTFALDVSPDRAWGSVAVSGARSDGLAHIEIIEHLAGTAWIVPLCKELQGAYKDARVIVDKRGPAASLIPDLQAAGVRVIEAATEDYGRACAAIYDDIVTTRPRLRYPAPQPDLDAAVAGARTRPLGDAWAWSRKSSSVDITPLVASSLARWGAQTQGPEAPPGVWDLNEVVERLRREQAAASPPPGAVAAAVPQARKPPVVEFHRF